MHSFFLRHGVVQMIYACEMERMYVAGDHLFPCQTWVSYIEKKQLNYNYLNKLSIAIYNCKRKSFT